MLYTTKLGDRVASFSVVGVARTGFHRGEMHRAVLFFLCACVCGLFGCASPQQLRPVSLSSVKVLPLALSDAFEFRKTILFLNGEKQPRSTDEMINARLRKINFGAIDNYDVIDRRGNYFSFFWKAHRDAEVALRLEYRTANRGDYVQAREINYQHAKGGHQTDFAVIGDDYADDGRVTSWRAILIENGRIVALNQSALWN